MKKLLLFIIFICFSSSIFSQDTAEVFSGSEGISPMPILTDGLDSYQILRFKNAIGEDYYQIVPYEDGANNSNPGFGDIGIVEWPGSAASNDSLLSSYNMLYDSCKKLLTFSELRRLDYTLTQINPLYKKVEKLSEVILSRVEE